MGRVTRIEPNQVVLASGIVNMKRFEQRPDELLVLGAVLDRSVRRIEDGATVTVVDAAMEQNRTRDWVITRLAVRTGLRLGRRRGEMSQLDWDEVDGLAAPQPAQGTASLLALLSALRPADMAAQLQD